MIFAAQGLDGQSQVGDAFGLLFGRGDSASVGQYLAQASSRVPANGSADIVLCWLFFRRRCLANSYRFVVKLAGATEGCMEFCAK